jgi:hypothetical protein
MEKAIAEVARRWLSIVQCGFVRGFDPRVFYGPDCVSRISQWRGILLDDSSHLLGFGRRGRK